MAGPQCMAVTAHRNPSTSWELESVVTLADLIFAAVLVLASMGAAIYVKVTGKGFFAKIQH